MPLNDETKDVCEVDLFIPEGLKVAGDMIGRNSLDEGRSSKRGVAGLLVGGVWAVHRSTDKNHNR